VKLYKQCRKEQLELQRKDKQQELRQERLEQRMADLSLELGQSKDLDEMVLLQLQIDIVDAVRKHQQGAEPPFNNALTLALEETLQSMRDRQDLASDLLGAAKTALLLAEESDAAAILPLVVRYGEARQ
jgi:DNA-binding protein Fis